MAIKIFIQVRHDVHRLKMFVIEYNGRYYYDTTDDWVYTWTFPKALLLVVTIMTTIGKFLFEKKKNQISTCLSH